MLFHLSHTDIQAVLKNIEQAKVKYLIATNISPLEENVDTFTGGFSPIDLRLPPFNLPEPVEIIPDHGVASNRYLFVWKVAAMAHESVSKSARDKGLNGLFEP